MNTNKYIELAKNIVLSKIPQDDYAVFLFGSRAEGTESRASDIDIGIIGNKELPTLLKIDIEEELEEAVIPYKVDVVDFKTVSDDFKRIALKKIIIWNSPKNITIN